MQQTVLNLWKNDYSFEYIPFFNFEINSFAKNLDQSTVISGNSKSGKKHLACKIAALKNIQIFEIEKLTDSEIIHIYDNNIKKYNILALFITNLSNLNRSLDVISRLNSLYLLNIPELKESQLIDYLILRLNRLGISLEPNLLNYTLIRLSVSYIAVDSFIAHLARSKTITLKVIKSFFEAKDEEKG